jgi:hypothetical protein
VTTAVPELRIVDDELWNLVKARQAEMRRVTSSGDPKRFNQARRPKYLFSGSHEVRRMRRRVRDVFGVIGSRVSVRDRVALARTA